MSRIEENELPPLPARTHAEAALHFRRPFAPGAIGFRALRRCALDGQPQGGAEVVAFISAQSPIQRLNCVVPGAWRMDFRSPPQRLLPAQSGQRYQGQGARKLYLVCRLEVHLPLQPGAAALEQAYSDIGEVNVAGGAGLKALLSDARKRAAAAAGIGTYLYTALATTILPVGPNHYEVQELAHDSGFTELVLDAQTVAWLRAGYAERMSSEAVRRDLGPILPHGEPESQCIAQEHEGACEVRDQDSAATTLPSAEELQRQLDGYLAQPPAGNGLAAPVVGPGVQPAEHISIDFSAVAASNGAPERSA